MLGIKAALATILFAAVIFGQQPNTQSVGTASADGRVMVPYRVTLVQAAPGKLIDLIDLYKKEFAATIAAGDEAPLWMRHSQGDHWDLMILQPMDDVSDFFSREKLAKRNDAVRPFTVGKRNDIAWQEDLYCFGPPTGELRKAFDGGGFFHVEMFVALASHFDDLDREREMENAYARGVHQPENFIFVRDSGAAWDLFTIGVFRDLKHYAESANLTPQQQDTAAKAAGFSSASDIGPYLRRFINTHHDTLAVAIK